MIGDRAVLGDGAVGAGDGVIAGGGVPRRTKGDGRPLRDRAAELNARQTAAICERKKINARHAVGNHNARQTAAICERPITNARHAVGNNYARQTAATPERKITNARHAVGNGIGVFRFSSWITDQRRFIFIEKNAVFRAVIHIIFVNGNLRQTASTVERRITDTRSTRDDNRFQGFGNIYVICRIRICTKYVSELRITCSVRSISSKR